MQEHQTVESRLAGGRYVLLPKSRASSLDDAFSSCNLFHNETCELYCDCWLSAFIARLDSKQTYCGLMNGSKSPPEANTYSLRAFCRREVSHLFILRVANEVLESACIFLLVNEVVSDIPVFLWLADAFLGCTQLRSAAVTVCRLSWLKRGQILPSFLCGGWNVAASGGGGGALPVLL